MSHRRERAEKRGRRGEDIAAWWLRIRGWRILDARVRTPRGEVDLVASRGSTLAFIEVKARRDAGSLDQAIDAFRLKRVIAAAEALSGNYGDYDSIRVDVILVAPWRLPRHLVNIGQML